MLLFIVNLFQYLRILKLGGKKRRTAYLFEERQRPIITLMVFK